MLLYWWRAFAQFDLLWRLVITAEKIRQILNKLSSACLFAKSDPATLADYDFSAVEELEVGTKSCWWEKTVTRTWRTHGVTSDHRIKGFSSLCVESYRHTGGWTWSSAAVANGKCFISARHLLSLLSHPASFPLFPFGPMQMSQCHWCHNVIWHCVCGGGETKRTAILHYFKESTTRECLQKGGSI